MTIPPEYRVIRSLGLGATSEVFEAVKTDVLNPTAPGISVALKVFSPLVLSDSDAVQRLRGEVEALECLRHANIVALRSTVTRPDFFALELELIIGSDLRQWALGYDSALYEPKMWILAQVARGLGAAHENGVLHRDLKPENVLVGHDGCVKLTDFGLSRSISRLTLTRMGLLVGSLGYMAPECVNGLRATERSDLFSFGVIAYELLAGRAPFEAETPQALIKKITDGLFQPLKQACPSIPDAVADEIDRCLA
jgi:serine/threonine protein kinase